HARLAFARLAREAEGGPPLGGRPGLGADAAKMPWVMLKWALAAGHVGRWDEATTALQQLGRQYGTHEMRIGGRTLTGAVVAQQQRSILAPAEATPAPSRDWP